MDTPRIRKGPRTHGPPPNLEDYDRARASFDWTEALGLLGGLPVGGLNIAHEAVERHAASELAHSVAIRWLGAAGEREEITYAGLAELSRRFANVLTGLGLEPGEGVSVISGRVPEHFVAALGTLRYRAVFCPLSPSAEPGALEAQLNLAETRVLVTTAALWEHKVRWIRDRVPTLDYVILIGDHRGPSNVPHCLDWRGLIDDTEARHPIPDTDPEDPALLHFTSGTSGTPKGVVHVHEAVVMHHLVGRLALDLHPGDVYWCTAEPGHIAATTCGLVAPLTNGATLIVDEVELDVDRAYAVLEQEGVQVWHIDPRFARALVMAGEEAARCRDLSSLRLVVTAGEPLDAASVEWSHRVLQRPFHDSWGQTETGGIIIANYRAMDVKPGSMGRPVPCTEVAVVARDEEGRVEVLESLEAEGELALRTAWPSMMRAYIDAAGRHGGCFQDGWYLTGDRVRRDPEGYYWFLGRADHPIVGAGRCGAP